nr:Druantia anti-phage system protein DruA [Candidatus Accumulibacter phosphatis]
MRWWRAGIRRDWLEHWGYQPLLLESFVDPRHHAGTCYRAAGWQLLGETSGRALARPGPPWPVLAGPITARPARCGSSRSAAMVATGCAP